jgi:hypothetical protein
MEYLAKIKNNKESIIIISIALISVIFEMAFNNIFEYHRDELLYLSFSQHPDFGYFSVPPLIGLFAFIATKIFGYNLFAARFFPAMAGALLIYLSSLIARELKGNFYSQILTALCIAGSILFVRAFGLFQPVVFDILFWTILIYLIIRYINTNQNKYLLYFGIALGFGFLNKYNIVFLIIPVLLVLSFTKYRRIFISKYFYFAALIAFVIALPNLIWQIFHQLPVINHMEELRNSQLSKMSPVTFLIEQVLMILPTTFIGFAGLFYLLLSKKMNEYKLIGFISLAVLLLFLIMKGKSYYTAGIYPVLITAGSVLFGNILKRNYSRIILIAAILFLEWQFLPMGKPFYSSDKLVSYFDEMAKKSGNDNIRRFEDNKHHKLPQDYADMLGWNELAEITNKAWQKVDNKNACIIYAENYGQAGAISIIGKEYKLPEAICFNDNFRYWIPKSLPTEITEFIYINDELGKDIKELFSDIKEIGRINNPLAREYGTQVYLCKKPNQSFNQFWKARIKEI